jgi:hypothetical protein
MDESYEDYDENESDEMKFSNEISYNNEKKNVKDDTDDDLTDPYILAENLYEKLKDYCLYNGIDYLNGATTKIVNNLTKLIIKEYDL